MYATNNAQCVSVFLTDGSMCQTIGREQSDLLVYDRTFAQYVKDCAHDLVVTSNDELLVVDRNHNAYTSLQWMVTTWASSLNLMD